MTLEPETIIDYSGIIWTRAPLFGQYDSEFGDTEPSLESLDHHRGPLRDEDTGNIVEL